MKSSLGNLCWILLMLLLSAAAASSQVINSFPPLYASMAASEHALGVAIFLSCEFPEMAAVIVKMVFL